MKSGLTKSSSSPTSIPSLGVGTGDRLDDDQQGVAEELDLGSLLGLDRVLDRELVQVELAGDAFEFLRRGFDHAEPDEGVVGTGGIVGLLEAELTGPPLAVLIDGAIDDHPAQYRHRAGPTGRFPG